MKIATKYKPKKATAIAYNMFLILCVLLIIGRWYSVIDNDFVFINKEIHSHLSNLVLSMVFYLAIGYWWLLQGVKFQIVAGLGIAFILANFICEILMGFMNTPDIMDAVYGTAGTIPVFLFLLIVNRHGLTAHSEKQTE